MNRNSKRYPKEEIIKLKKTGKRLRGGYVLTRLKNWKKRRATAKRVNVDLPVTEIDRPKMPINRPLKRVRRGIKRRERSKKFLERRRYWKGEETKPTPMPKKERTVKAKAEKVERAMPIPKKERTVKAKAEKVERAMPKKERPARAKKNDLIVETVKKANKPKELANPLSELEFNTRTGGKFSRFYTTDPAIIVKELNNYWENEKARDFEHLLDVNERFLAEDHSYRIDFVEYCMLSSGKYFGEKPNKETLQLVKTVKNKKFFENPISLFPYAKETKNLMVRAKEQQKISKVNLPIFEKIVSAFAGDDELHPAMLGVFYNGIREEIVLTDSYKLIVIPTKYVDKSIVDKLHVDSITAYKVKGRKNWEKIDDKFPAYQNVIPTFEDLKIASYIHVDTELDKCNQLQYMMGFHNQLNISKQFVKFSKDGEHLACNFMYLKQCMETLKLLGIDTVTLKRMKQNGNTRAQMFIVEDIKILLMPVRFNGSMDIPSFDPCYYDFANPENDSSYLPFFNDNNQYDRLYEIKPKLNKFLEEREKNQNTDKAKEREGGMSDDVAEPSLYDDINPNVNAGEEIKAIASDIPAFGDDIKAEELELDSKFDLPPTNQNRDNMEVASAKDIRSMKFKAMTLPSKYKQLLGKVPANFRLLLWGAPGHGKSTLALNIANDVGKYVKTLYVSAEESLQSATLASRIKRFKANARNLMFNDSNNPDIIEKIILTQNPKFIVIDSVNVMIGKTEAMINLMLKYPDIGFILIAQATKDRKRYAGLGSLAHAVDIVVNVKSGIATAEKNRYSQLGSMPVKGIKI